LISVERFNKFYFHAQFISSSQIKNITLNDAILLTHIFLVVIYELYNGS